MRYRSLHHHTTFSYLDGHGLPFEHVARAVELEMPAFAVTEHGNVSSHVQFEKAAVAAGIKPIFGCELYTGPDTAQKTKWHLGVLAMDAGGYSNLLKVVSAGWENFYYSPTVTGRMLREYGDGLIVLSGCAMSKMAGELCGTRGGAGGYEAAKRTAARFKELFGDRFYLEVQAFPDYENTCRINPAYEQISAELGIPLVATADVHYVRPELAEMQQLLHGIRTGKAGGFEDDALAYEHRIACTFYTDREMWQLLRRTGLSRAGAERAVLATEEIAARCSVTLPKMERLRMAPSPAESWELFLKQLRVGWAFRGVDRLEPSRRREYVARVRHEMEAIREKDFVDYFLFTADLTVWAKEHGVPVGPARGSAAASLVCWLLRITEVDPMLFPSLLFERFIDITREDLPDIDLDFDDERRDRVRLYLEEKWGKDRVGVIGTFTQFKGKNSLDDVARVYSVPKYEIDEFKEYLIERSSGDLRASATVEDTVEMFPQAAKVFERHPVLRKAQRLEGNYRGMGVHAAGLVVGEGPLRDVVATYTRRTGDVVRQVLSVDKYDAEHLGIMKADILGLSTLGMIRIAIEMIGMTIEELYAIPLDDAETLRGFRDNDIVGVFQFDGRAQRSVCEQVRPETFMELADINALARPGPLHSGAAADYIEVKRGLKPKVEVHPRIDAITSWTNGVVVYQEQILQIVREVGGFGIWEASTIRRIISKKQGEQAFNRYEKQFVAGALEMGLSEELGLRVWRGLITAGAYAFNAAHAVSYSMIGFWCMWLKRHHPFAFYVAALIKMGDKEDAFGRKKARALLLDAMRHGVQVFPPDVNVSGVDWTVEREEPADPSSRPVGIRAGLAQVHGIGERAAGALVQAREGLRRRRAELDGEDAVYVVDYEDLVLARPKGAAYNMATIKRLRENEENEDPFGMYRLKHMLDAQREVLFGDELQRWPVPTHTSSQVPYEAVWEDVVWLGTLIERNLKDLFELHYSRTGEELDPSAVKDPHLVNWVVALGEDDTDVLTITWDRWRYAAFKDRIWDATLHEDLVLVKGVKKPQYRRAIYVREMWVFKQDGRVLGPGYVSAGK